MTAPPRGGGGRGRLYGLAAGLFLIGLLLLFLAAPSATVNVVIAANPVSAHSVIQGTPDAIAAAGPDHVLTQVVSADESSSFTAKPTGQKQINASAAAGTIVMQTDLPNGACLTGIRKGQTYFQTSGNPAVVFLANADVTSNTQKPDCQGLYVAAPQGGAKYGPASDPVPIVAQSPGSAANQAAGAVNTWPSNPCASNPLCASSDIKLSNPSATQGGVDQHTVTVVSDQDVQQFKQQFDQIDKQLKDKVKGDLQAKAPTRQFAIDPTGQGLSVTEDSTPSLPASGDQAQPTQITINVHGKAAMYSPDDVKKDINQDLINNSVPRNTELVSKPPPISKVTITQAGDDGTVVFDASETAFTQPVVDARDLAGKLTGKTKTAAAASIRARYGDIVQDIRIDQSIPFFTLPFFSGRIEVDICVQSQGQQGSPCG